MNGKRAKALRNATGLKDTGNKNIYRTAKRIYTRYFKSGVSCSSLDMLLSSYEASTRHNQLHKD